MGEPVRCHKLLKGKFKVVLHFHRQIKNIEMKLQIGFFVKKKKVQNSIAFHQTLSIYISIGKIICTIISFKPLTAW